jgi:hypothetical protein
VNFIKKKFKKIIFYFILITFSYLIVASIVFTFSYASLIYGKTYDLFWIKSIQKKIYFRGLRNIWQNDKDCAVYDKDLLYKPKEGKCQFSNPEFKTTLSFTKFYRNQFIENTINDKKNPIIVIGDSIAMGWGVNDNETFSFHLEKLIKRKVYNMGVSSYGTVREIKRLKLSPFYDETDTIIIQYHPNDLGENMNLDFEKYYSENEYNKIFSRNDKFKNTLKFILKNYKTSIRLFFSDINDILFKYKNLEKYNFNIHKEYLEQLLLSNIDLKQKKILVIIIKNPWQQFINFPVNRNGIRYIQIDLDKSDFFLIDDHPNSLGHKKISNVLKESIYKMNK